MRRGSAALLLSTAEYTAMCTRQPHAYETHRLAYTPARHISCTPVTAKHTASSGSSHMEENTIHPSIRNSAKQRSVTRVTGVTARQAARVISMIMALHTMEHMLYDVGRETPTPVHVVPHMQDNVHTRDRMPYGSEGNTLTR